jgi:hypothetical protein
MRTNDIRPDTAVLEAAAALANLAPESVTARDVNSILERVARRIRRSTASRWNPATDALMPAIKQDLAFLRGGLDALRKTGALTTEQRRRLDKNYLPNVAGSLALIKTERGFALRLYPELTGVASVVAYALALLSDTEAGLAQRVGYCAWERCTTRYFIAITEGSGRFKTHYCSVKHRNAAAKKAQREREAAAAAKVPTGRRSRTGKTKQ